MRNIFCPNCGNGIEVDENKSFCFCPECGNRIELAAAAKKSNNAMGNAQPTEQANDYLEEKLKEVEFYYNLSCQKKEYQDKDKQPVYYIKAQDILVDLSDEYENDYRIWWNLAKPIDYSCDKFTPECITYSLNEMHFQKALDVAPLSGKMELIQKHNDYLARKKDYIQTEKDKEEARIREEEEKRKKIEQERIEQEKRKQAEQEKRLEEERIKQEKERQKKLEEDRIRREKAENAERERQKKLEEERIRREKEEQEKQRQLEEKKRENAIKAKPFNDILYAEFGNKNYQKIDGSYTSYVDDKQDTIVIAIRNISNMPHLIAYRESSHNGAVYNIQTIAVKIDSQGQIIGFNNKPVILAATGEPIVIRYSDEVTLTLNDMALISDKSYSDGLLKTAKKAIIKSRIFK